MLAGRDTRAFVGREAELAVLVQELHRTREGEPRLVWVTGEPGIGKSTLLRHLTESAAGVSVLWASGDEAETALMYGVLEQLRSGLPKRPGVATTSMVEPAGQPADPLQVGAELLADIGTLQGSGPVVVVVDDAQWVDEPSARALVFLVRRLRRDQVMLILGVRTGAEPPAHGLWDRALAQEQLVRRLTLTGLGAGDLTQLSPLLGGPNLSAVAARRLHEHTGGHPLYVRSLLEELPPAALLDMTRELPAPRSLSTLMVVRLSRLSPPAQELVLAAAVLGRRAALSDVVSVAALADPGAALDEAVTSGLLLESRAGAIRQLEFPHQLMRTAVYDDLSPERRAGLHRRAAELIGSGPAALVHRAAAAAGPDPQLAVELTELAQRELASGNWKVAVAHLGTAADLSPTPELRAERLARAAEAMLAGGDIAGALSLEPVLRTPLPSATRSRVLGQLAVFTGRFAAAREEFDRVEADPAGATGGLGAVDTHLSVIAMIEGRMQTAADLGSAALHAGPRSPTADLARFMSVLALAAQGRHADAAALAGATDPAVGSSESPAPTPSVESLALRGFLALWSDHPAQAKEDLAEVARRATPSKRLQGRVLVLGHLAEAQYRTGSWDDASVNAELARSLADDAGIQLAAGVSRAVASFVASGRGQWDLASRLVSEAAAAAAAAPWWSSRAYAATSAAVLAQANGNHRAMLASLRTFDDPAVRTPMDGLGVVVWRVLRVEALLGLGDLQQAEDELTAVESRLVNRGETWSAMDAARLRAELTERRHAAADDVAVRAAYDRAMTLTPTRGSSLGAARLELAYGRYLLGVGERRPAVDLLRSARGRLHRLGAEPFQTACDSLLNAAGLPPQPSGDRLGLTAQELAVVRLVATGRTNHEVGAELFVTGRTVAYHLSNIYAKTGLTSRRELARRFPDLLPQPVGSSTTQ